MWRADILCALYRGSKRKHDCVENPEQQNNRKISLSDYKNMVRGIFRVLCSMPIGTKTRHEFKHTIEHPTNKCAYVDIKMFIDIRPSNLETMEVTLFKKNDFTNNVEEQIAHVTLTPTSCMTTIENMLAQLN